MVDERERDREREEGFVERRATYATACVHKRFHGAEAGALRPPHSPANVEMGLSGPN